jgi:hypothetical protein
MARKRLAPLGHEYVVYTSHPPWEPRCKVETLKIPHGQTFRDVKDQLPASVGKMQVVRAQSVASARAYAGMDVRCRMAFAGGRRRKNRR